MEIIDQYTSVWGECPSDPEKAVEWIERAGRVCYRSEDKIIEGSGVKFVNGIIKRKHYSVVEHSNLVFRTVEKLRFPVARMQYMKSFFNSPFFNFHIHHDQVYVSGNWRAWIEWFNSNTIERNRIENIDDFLDVIVYNLPNLYEVVEEDEIPVPIKNITAEFITDRAVSHELVRHRPASYSQESQRYVRYDGGMQFIKPAWYNTAHEHVKSLWKTSMAEDEAVYKLMINTGMKPEDARTFLPNSTATKIVTTASVTQWNHMFKLRLSPAAYPQIRMLLTPVYSYFAEREWIL